MITIAGRYQLVDLIDVRQPAAIDASGFRQFTVETWRGDDTTLNRSVLIRLLRTDDARVPSVLGAARAAAGIDDRRLLRVLDVVDVPAVAEYPARIAVVSEWATGRTINELLAQREGRPVRAEEALLWVGEVARALAFAADRDLHHGRLRPTCVIVTDADEVRVRGLSVDAAIFGPISAGGSRPAEDVDGLGGLVYALTTGMWPQLGLDPAVVCLPLAPTSKDKVLLPSSVRANIPRTIDDLVARSVLDAPRLRGVSRITDASGFAAATGAAADYLTPVSSTTTFISPPGASRTTGRTTAQTTGRWITRVVVSAAALVGVVFVGWLGLQLLSGGGGTEEVAGGTVVDDSILTSEATPFVEEFFSTSETLLPIISVRSYDPLADDDNNGRTDKKRGRENEESAGFAVDVDGTTAWITDAYPSRDLDGKGGVGLILDMGGPVTVNAINLGLSGFGTDVDVRVSDEIQRDPALWTDLVSIDAAGPLIDLRAPRPVTGRYVLVWLSGLPRISGTAEKGSYAGGIASVSVRGTAGAPVDS